MCFTAGLLFRSPHDTVAILFIDGGVRANREQPLEDGSILVPRDVSKVLMDRLATGSHLRRALWKHLSVRTASLFKVAVCLSLLVRRFRP